MPIGGCDIANGNSEHLIKDRVPTLFSESPSNDCI